MGSKVNWMCTYPSQTLTMSRFQDENDVAIRTLFDGTIFDNKGHPQMNNKQARKDIAIYTILFVVVIIPFCSRL